MSRRGVGRVWRAAALAVVLAVGHANAGAVAAPHAGVIVFGQSDGRHSEIWVVDPNGRHMAQFTSFGRRTPVDGAAEPALTRYGSKLAFVLSEGDASSLEVYAFYGGRLRRLTSNSTMDVNPSWSPGGQRIVYSRALGVGTAYPHQSLFVMDDHGRDKRRITDGPYVDQFPAWSPRGGLIAFSRYSPYSDFPTVGGVYVARKDGTDVRLLAPDGSEPAWSPDGMRIAFVGAGDSFGQVCAGRCYAAGEIYVMNADGTALRRLTRSRADDRSPVWSPDGRRIAWVRDVAAGPRAHHEVFVMRPDGGCRRRVTRTNPGVTQHRPSWIRSRRSTALPRCPS